MIDRKIAPELNKFKEVKNVAKLIINPTIPTKFNKFNNIYFGIINSPMI